MQDRELGGDLPGGFHYTLLALKAILRLSCRYLVDEMKCDVHGTDSQGRSVVYLASEQGSLELVQYLIEVKGCDNDSDTMTVTESDSELVTVSVITHS